MRQAAFVIGVGPGIGVSVARSFGKEGMRLGLIARSRSTVEAARGALAAAGVEADGGTADAGRPAELTAALDRLVERLGVPQVLVYNVGLIQADRPGELDQAAHLEAYSVNVLGALAAASHLAPAMAAAGGGTILLTGGMPEPEPAYVSLSLGKAGVRALTTLLARQYGPSGVHVATVTVGGVVAPGTAFDPDRIAERYVRLHRQPRDEWQQETLFAGD